MCALPDSVSEEGAGILSIYCLKHTFSFLSGEEGCLTAAYEDLYEAGSHCSLWKGPQQGRQPHCSPWKTSHWSSLSLKDFIPCHGPYVGAWVYCEEAYIK